MPKMPHRFSRQIVPMVFLEYQTTPVRLLPKIFINKLRMLMMRRGGNMRMHEVDKLTFEKLNFSLFNVPRYQKQLSLIALDASSISVAFLITVYLRYGQLDFTRVSQLAGLFCFSVLAGIVIFALLGVYKAVNRKFDIHSLSALLLGSLGVGMLIIFTDYLDQSFSIPRSFGLVCPFLIFLLTGLSRVCIRRYYLFWRNRVGARKPVIIYGAGEAGLHVASVLQETNEFNLLAFVDDDPSLSGRTVRGRQIYEPDDIEYLKDKFGDFRVLLCINNITNEQMLKVVSRFEFSKIKLEIVHSFKGIIEDRCDFLPTREINIIDLLSRDQVNPIPELFDNAISNKTVLITGAGGSIGSEICRQILQIKAKKLVLIDHSEPAVYALEQSLKKDFPVSGSEVEIHFELRSVVDRERIRHLMEQHRPDVVYHAAAYKHVPMIEDNRLAGIKNNAVGTLIVAEESQAAGAERFILVSTDKAVRPTNTMGATKRVAELIIQAIAHENGPCTFSMVRFGNVLGSSGSVVPLFINQIAEGGPVTVTHKEVNRFFMTLSEAAQLVIQAGFLAKGGEVFILDMGKPHRIDDLARTMIKISGHTVKSEKNPVGDIEVVYTGLRPGEKLYEEVLIDPTATETNHPKILTAKEPMIEPTKMRRIVKTIQTAIQNNDAEAVEAIFRKVVTGYSR